MRAVRGTRSARCETLVRMREHCCAEMTRRVAWRCAEHDDPFDCPDAVVIFDARFQEYGLIVRDGGRSFIEIHYCPWCGSRLPESRRDRWFAELEQRGIDPWTDEIPPEYQDDRWLHS
ncbi:hypothetical protein TBS_28280 [Thermobispora bispora]|jgi:hypothetical protein